VINAELDDDESAAAVSASLANTGNGGATLTSPIGRDTLPIEDEMPVKPRQLQQDDPNLKFVLDCMEAGQIPSPDDVKLKAPMSRN